MYCNTVSMVDEKLLNTESGKEVIEFDSSDNSVSADKPLNAPASTDDIPHELRRRILNG